LAKTNPSNLAIFTDRKGRLIGDVELPSIDELNDPDEETPVEIPGVAGEETTPQITDNTIIDLVDQEIIQDEPRLQTDIEPVDNTTHKSEPPGVTDTHIPADVVQPQRATTPAAPPDRIPEVRRSTRVKFWTKQDYVPSISGSSKYAYAVTQLESQGALYPDAHMFFQQDIYQSEPNIVAAIMTQLSLKAGLKAWGTEAKEVVHSEMKQLHFRDTFNPMHWK
jgi:hypothetical protein